MKIKIKKDFIIQLPSEIIGLTNLRNGMDIVFSCADNDNGFIIRKKL